MFGNKLFFLNIWMVSVRLAECFDGKKTSIWSFLVLDLLRKDADQILKSLKNLDVQI